MTIAKKFINNQIIINKIYNYQLDIQIIVLKTGIMQKIILNYQNNNI